jgi:hypothetical protein
VVGKLCDPTQVPHALSLTKDQNAVLSWLRSKAKPRDLVVCDDPMVSYLVSTYTAVRSWQGHVYNTPSIRQRQGEVTEALKYGRVFPAWESTHVLYVGLREHSPKAPPGTFQQYQNSEFEIWGRPRKDSSRAFAFR